MNISELIKEFCVENGFDFRPYYSGRCMFGGTCVGLVCDDICQTLLELAQWLWDSDIDDVVNSLGSPKWDNMGKQMILYFPKVEV